MSLRLLMVWACLCLALSLGSTVAAEPSLNVAPELAGAYAELGGSASLGEPVSWVLRGPDRIEQYFERARLEVSTTAGTRPTLGHLGAELTAGRQFTTVEPFTSTNERWYFAETRHSLGQPMLVAWQQRGGLNRFGFPISEPLIEQGRQVQYFERARLEVTAEGHVETAALGREVWQSQLTLATTPVEEERQLAELVNGARAQAGLAPLTLAPALQALARARSTDMASRGYFGHRTPEGRDFGAQLAERGILYRFAGETIQRNNFAASATVGEALRSLLASPAHRAILLDGRFQHIGVGHQRSDNGIHYYTLILLQA
jgi:uncharacterized protein YkwD